MKFLFKLIMLLIVVVAAVGVWIWSGAYNIGADVPHWATTRTLIDALREHSVERRAEDIRVPKLDDPALVREGAGHYARMCTGCHLAPGMDESEMRQGLYPQPPNLTRFSPDPAEAFWVIKHGIKMSAMPAWGATHDDQKIWAMVAYLQKQPTLSVERYHELAGSAAMHGSEEHEGESAETGSASPQSPQQEPQPAMSASAPASAASTMH